MTIELSGSEMSGDKGASDVAAPGQVAPFTIYVVQHKPSQPLSDPNFVQIYVGPRSKEWALDHSAVPSEGICSDATGENISAKNDSYCELTAFYWAWKNAPRSKYIGFMHYRRHLNFSGVDQPNETKHGLVEYDCIDEAYEALNGLNAGRVNRLIETYDILLPRKWDVTNEGSKHLEDHYLRGPAHVAGDYDKMLGVIGRVYPEYKPFFREVGSAKRGYFTNMFVMKWEIFDAYCQWLFGILGELERELDISSYSTQQRRVFGFLSEWMFNIFMAKYTRDNPRCKILELQRTFVRNAEAVQTISPAFSCDAVPIVLSFDDKYAKYAGALIESIKENAAADKFYDIVVFNSGVSEHNKDLTVSLVEPFPNISIRFFDVRQHVSNLHLPVHAHFSVETYFRLFIPRIMGAYQKVLYLDSDMVVLKDVSPLIDIEIGENLVAAVRDCVMEGMCKFAVPSMKQTGSLPAAKYLKDYLGMARPEDYFQAGVMIFNNEAINKTDFIDQIVDKIKSKPFWFLDQDILNQVCAGRVHFLDMKWNTFFGNGDTDTFFENLPKARRDEFFEAVKAPYILHFAGERKPWNFVGIKYGHAFWRFARNTPWYEEVLRGAMGGGGSHPHSNDIAARRPRAARRSGWKSFVQSVKAIGYILFPIGKRRRKKRKDLMAGIR